MHGLPAGLFLYVYIESNNPKKAHTPSPKNPKTPNQVPHPKTPTPKPP